MRFMNHVGTYAGVIWKGMKEHSHTVMAIGAIAGLAGSIILTYKKTPKIKAIMEEQRGKVYELEEKAANDEITEEEVKAERKVITKETVKRLIPEAGPVVLVAMASAGLMGGSAYVGEMKLTHVRDLLTISETYNRDLIEEVKSKIGEDEFKEIDSKIAEEQLKRKTERMSDEDIEAGIWQADGGRELYYDKFTRQLFYSDDTTIMKAVNNVNKWLSRNGGQDYATLNDLYREMGLPTMPIAEYLGVGRYAKVTDFEVTLDHAIKLSNGRSATVFDFRSKPVTKFRGDDRGDYNYD